MAETAQIDDGGPAFSGGLFEPQHGGLNDREPWNAGMSLRQYYAGQALIGLVSMHHGIAVDPITTARASTQYADALIAALKEGAR